MFYQQVHFNTAVVLKSPGFNSVVLKIKSNQIIDDVIILVHGVVLKGYHTFYNNVVSVKHVLLLMTFFFQD